jgi:hypothetical protein
MLHRPLTVPADRPVGRAARREGDALTGMRHKKAGGVRARLPLRDHTCGTAWGASRRTRNLHLHADLRWYGTRATSLIVAVVVVVVAVLMTMPSRVDAPRPEHPGPVIEGAPV